MAWNKRAGNRDQLTVEGIREGVRDYWSYIRAGLVCGLVLGVLLGVTQCGTLQNQRLALASATPESLGRDMDRAVSDLIKACRQFPDTSMCDGVRGKSLEEARAYFRDHAGNPEKATP